MMHLEGLSKAGLFDVFETIRSRKQSHRKLEMFHGV